MTCLLMAMIPLGRAAFLERTVASVDTREGPAVVTVDVPLVGVVERVEASPLSVSLGGAPVADPGFVLSTSGDTAHGHGDLLVQVPVARMRGGGWTLGVQLWTPTAVVEALQISVPVPTLDAQLSSSWILRAPGENTAYRVLVRETSGQAAIYGAEVSWEGGRLADGSAASDEIACTLDTPILQGGGSASALCVSKEAPPSVLSMIWEVLPVHLRPPWVADVSGGIRIAAINATPVRKELTLSKRGARYLLAVPMALGLLLSWFLQGVIGDRLKTLDAVRQAATRLLQVREKAAASQSPVVRLTVQRAMAASPAGSGRRADVGSVVPPEGVDPALYLAISKARALEEIAGKERASRRGSMSPTAAAGELPKALDEVEKALERMLATSTDEVQQPPAGEPARPLYVRDLTLRHTAAAILRWNSAAKWLATLVAFLGAVSTNWDGWHGDPQDALNVLIWALGLHISTAAVVDWAKSRPQPSRLPSI